MSILITGGAGFIGSNFVLDWLAHFYAPEYEQTLLWNDPDLAIDWPLTDAPRLSSKDQKGRLLSDFFK